MRKIQKHQTGRNHSQPLPFSAAVFRLLFFGFVSDFEFRISDLLSRSGRG
jgi:hypothetical protein